MTEVKVVVQKYTTVDGMKQSYAVIIDGLPRYTFYSKAELNAFLRGLNGEM